MCLPEGIKVIVNAKHDGFPDSDVADDPLVGGGDQEDVDEDDLVAPVVSVPELQVAGLARGEVSDQLDEGDQAAPELRLRHGHGARQVARVHGPPRLDKLRQRRQLVTLWTLLAASSHGL